MSILRASALAIDGCGGLMEDGEEESKLGSRAAAGVCFEAGVGVPFEAIVGGRGGP